VTMRAMIPRFLFSMLCVGCADVPVATPEPPPPTQGSTRPPPPRGEVVPEYRLEVRRERLGVIYEHAEVEARVAALDWSSPIVVQGNDIAEYRVDGETQGLSVQLVLTPEAAARLGDELVAAEEAAPFRVLLGGEVLVVGLIYFPMGAAALTSPILHVERGEQLVVHLDERIGMGMGMAAPEGQRLVDRAEIRDAFRRANALVVR
jgi:hypothetical protein